MVCGTTFRAATSFCGWSERPLENRAMLVFDIAILAAAFIVAFLDDTAAKLLRIKKDKSTIGAEPTPTTE